MDKLINFLINITITRKSMYIQFFKIFLIGITYKRNTGVSNASSLTLGIYKLHCTFIVSLQNDNILDGHGES